MFALGLMRNGIKERTRIQLARSWRRTHLRREVRNFGKSFGRQHTCCWRSGICKVCLMKANIWLIAINSRIICIYFRICLRVMIYTVSVWYQSGLFVESWRRHILCVLAYDKHDAPRVPAELIPGTSWKWKAMTSRRIVKMRKSDWKQEHAHQGRVAIQEQGTINYVDDDYSR